MKTFLLFLVSVQFSFRKKNHILSFSKNKNRSQKQSREKSKEQIRNQGGNFLCKVANFVDTRDLLVNLK